MSRANVARHGGDQYQACWFWLNAAKLLDSKSAVCRVAWEQGPKSVDDVVIDYDPPRQRFNGRFEREYVQCKWHVRPGLYGYEDLKDPEFIGGTSNSWLQRAYDAYIETGNLSARFELKTNWHIDNNNPLGKLYRGEHGGINVDKLFDGTTARSENGAVRACWCDHLCITEEELRAFVSCLGFMNIANTLDSLNEQLNDRLTYAGMKPAPISQSSSIYNDLIIKMHQQGEVSFDEMSFRAMCDREGLWAVGETKVRPYTIGIRSFMHRIDSLEDRCDDLLDLVPHFDDRFLKAGRRWNGDVDTELDAFLTAAASDHESLHLILDAHASIATAAGRVLDVKCGRKLCVEQRVPNAGRQVWTTDAGNAGAPFVISTDEIPDADIVVALSVTHDVKLGVDAYCAANLSNCARIDARPAGEPGGNSINSGSHAWQIISQLVEEIWNAPVLWPLVC